MSSPRSAAPLLAVLALAGLGTGLARVTTSLYAVAIRCTPAELGLLAACQSGAVALMSVPSGALVRRHGPVTVFVAGSLLAGLASAVVPLVSGSSSLIACVTAMSVSLPLRFVATNVVTIRRIDGAGGARAGWYRAAHLLSMLVAGPAVAVPVVAALGPRSAWWVVAGALLLPAWTASAALGGPDPSSRAARAARAGGDPEALRLALTELVAQGTFTFFSFFVVPLAVEKHGLSAAAAAGLLAANAATLVVALLALGGVAPRGSRGSRALAAHGAAAAGLLLLGLARDGAWLYAGSLVLGVGLGLVQLENLVRSARVAARVGEGATSGLQILAGSAGGLVGGVLGGALEVQLVFLLLAPAFAWLGARPRAVAVSSSSRPGPDGPGTAPSRSPASSCGPEGCAD